MAEATLMYVFWALTLGAVSAVSLPLGSLVGLNVRFNERHISILAAFGAGALIAALSVELVAPTAMALIEPGHADTGAAHTHFFALLVGGVFGGLLFVVLDAVVNEKGGHLRKTSTTLAYMAERRREVVRKVMQAVLEAPPFDNLPKEMADLVAGMLRPVNFKRDQIEQHLTTRLNEAVEWTRSAPAWWATSKTTSSPSSSASSISSIRTLLRCRVAGCTSPVA